MKDRAQLVINVPEYGSDTIEEEEEQVKSEDEVKSTGLSLMFYLSWYSAVIIMHLLKGSQQTASKYLKSDQDTDPPEYSTTGVGDMIVVVLYTPRMMEKMFFYLFVDHKNSGNSVKGKAGNVWSCLKPIISHWSMYGFVLVTFLKAFAKDKALGWTNAILTQSVLLFAPFVTVLVTTLILKKGRLTWQIILTLIITSLGSIVLILGDSTSKERGFFFLPDFHVLGEDFHRTDLIGLALALVSAICSGLSTVFIDYAVDNHYFHLSCENLFYAERMIQGIPFLLLTLVFGDITQFTRVTMDKWLVFFGIAIGCKMIGSYLNIYSTAKLGASTVGIFLPIRLIASLVAAVFLSGEAINNLLQIIGIFVISASLVGYMIWKKYHDGEIGPNQKTVIRHAMYPKMEPFSDVRVHHYSI